jgi:hypothetical protein
VFALAVAVAAGRTELGAKRAHAALEAILSDPASPENQAAERLTAWSHAVEAEIRREAEIVRALAADREGAAKKLAVMDGRVGELAGTLARTTTRLEEEARAAQQSAALAVASLAAAGQGRGDSSDTGAPVPNAAASGMAGTAAVAAPGAAAHGAKEGLRPAAASPATPGQTRALAAMPALPQVPIASPVASAAPDAVPAYTGAIPLPAAPENAAAVVRPSAAAAQAGSSIGLPGGEPMAAPVPLPRPKTARAPAAGPESPAAAPFPASPLMTAGIFGTPVEPGEIATAFAIDLGPAGTIEAARMRWTALLASQSPLLDNLKPLITVKDGGRSGQELHLIAGPLNSMAGSVRLCAVLAGSASCQPTAFEGQRLAVR